MGPYAEEPAWSLAILARAFRTDFHMSNLSRRGFVASGASAAFAAGSIGAQPRDALQAWLGAHAVPVRSIDIAEEDFSDLEPLADAIGSARVVQLGEPSHGAGSCFAAKARIAKFLHRHHGFDVLIWESGLYDVALAQAAMRGTDDAMTAARRGIFALWSESAEIRPLFEYIKASQETVRPLEMAGFDMQVTADGSTARFAEDLRGFAHALRDPDLRRQMMSLVEQAVGARERLFASRFTGQSDLDTLTVAAQSFGTLVRSRRADFERVRGELGTSFMARATENMWVDATQRFEFTHAPATTPERENRRDLVNAVNLRWLLEERYAGRKALVWAHNVHVMNAYYDSSFRTVHLDPRPGDMKPTGVFTAAWAGTQVYTLGMTTFAGEDGLATGGATSQIPPAPEGSLEAYLHALGHPYAFVDFRAGYPMSANEIVRLPKYDSNAISDIGRIYSGIVFVDRMARATRAA